MAATAAAPKHEEKKADVIPVEHIVHGSKPLQFYGCDMCPYAQRSWIALLEKEADPAHPALFDYHHVNLSRKQPELKLVNPNETVPSGVHNGNNLYESLLFNEYIEEVFPVAGKALLPGTPGGKFRARLLIEKHKFLTEALFQLIMQQEAEAQKPILAKILTAFEKFSDDITGPFVFGEQFTLVDIALFPFVERLFIVGAHYRGLVVPHEAKFAKVHAWYAAVSARPSVAITTGPRSADSIRLGSFDSVDHKSHLLEVFEGFAYGQAQYARSVMATAKPGKSPFAPGELKRRAEADAVSKRAAAATAAEVTAVGTAALAALAAVRAPPAAAAPVAASA